jgi:hypothetical protein
MLIGAIFSVGIIIYSIVRHRKKGILTAIAGAIAFIIFLGQFIVRL